MNLNLLAIIIRGKRLPHPVDTLNLPILEPALSTELHPYLQALI